MENKGKTRGDQTPRPVSYLKSVREQLTPFDSYEGKFFYQVVKPDDVEGAVYLYGPLTNVYYANSKDPSSDVGFVQVINGIPTATFKKNEILVTDKVL